MAVQDEAPRAMGRYRRGNVGRINERETDAVRETDRGHRILNHLMMEYDHPGAARVTLQDRLECLQLRWIDDADRIGQRKVAAGIRIEENYTVSVIPRPGFDQRETLLPDLCHFLPPTERAVLSQVAQVFHSASLAQVVLRRW